MPRRAPKKPAPGVDLSSHFSMLGDLPECFDPTSLFLNDHPVELEVGSGKGLFLVSFTSLELREVLSIFCIYYSFTYLAYSSNGTPSFLAMATCERVSLTVLRPSCFLPAEATVWTGFFCS